MQKIVVTALSAALGLVLATSAQAQIGQGKTMTLMVPYPAGGISDSRGSVISAATTSCLRLAWRSTWR